MRVRCGGAMVVFAVAVTAPMVAVSSSYAQTTVAILPFDDRARLKDSPWDLSVDIPAWFAATIDTIGRSRDSLVRCIPFEHVQALIRENRWTRREWTAPLVMQTIASRLDAAYLVTGTIERFRLVKRALNADGALGGTHGVSTYARGAGGTPVTIGLQSYTAHVQITAAIYDGRSGNLVQTVPIDVDERDGGLKVWLPVGTENDELNFYYMSVKPFGSEYFHKTIAGAVMKRCSQILREALVGRIVAGQASLSRATASGFVEGKVLDVEGDDVYLNLGSADNLMLGQELEILRPERPVLTENGDTLGWVEVPCATIRIRSIKAAHFSQATVEKKSDGIIIRPAWSVRSTPAQTGEQ